MQPALAQQLAMAISHGHSILLTGHDHGDERRMLFCTRCGAYSAGGRLVKLARPCTHDGERRRTQHQRLLAGRHPATNQPLEAPRPVCPGCLGIRGCKHTCPTDPGLEDLVEQPERVRPQDSCDLDKDQVPVPCAPQEPDADHAGEQPNSGTFDGPPEEAQDELDIFGFGFSMG